MFAYMNYGALSVVLFIGLFIFIINSTGAEKKSHKGFFISLSFFVGLLLLDANNTATTAKESIHSFKHRSLTLKCTIGGGLYSKSKKYQVSKSDGWSVDKGYFIKDSLMIDASRCERW